MGKMSKGVKGLEQVDGKQLWMKKRPDSSTDRAGGANKTETTVRSS